jgi:hypothetical protein
MLLKDEMARARLHEAFRLPKGRQFTVGPDVLNLLQT